MKKILLIIFILFGINVSSQKDNLGKIIEESNSWIGVKYKWGGTTRKGIDCSAFVRNVYKNSSDIILPRTSRQQFKYTHSILQNKIRIGDLIFFSNSKGIHHVGLIINEEEFIHASSSRGVRIDSFKKGYWSTQKMSFRRII